MPLKALIGFTLNLQNSLDIKDILTIFFQSMSVANISVCLYHLQFLLLMSYSFQCTGLLPPWLKFLSSIYYFEVIVHGIFYFLFLIVHFWCIETQLILNHATLLNLLVLTVIWWILEFSKYQYNTMSSENRQFYFFLSNLDAFCSVSCLIALAWLRVVSNKSSENGYSCLLLYF